MASTGQVDRSNTTKDGTQASHQVKLPLVDMVDNRIECLEAEVTHALDVAFEGEIFKSAHAASKLHSR